MRDPTNASRIYNSSQSANYNEGRIQSQQVYDELSEGEEEPLTGPPGAPINQVFQQDDLVDFDFILDNGKVDERFLSKFEILSVLRGDFDPINEYMDEICFKNLDYKLNQHKQAHLIRKLLKIQQMGNQLVYFKMKC